MKFINTKIKNIHIIEPEPFIDHRGKFYRVFCENEIKEIGISKKIVQINQSLTKTKGGIRGIHFQYPPKAEIKIVKCISGSIFDVAVDLRKGSPTFLEWYGEILTEENMRMMVISEGFVHAFQALEENAEVIYFVTEFYSPKHESGVKYNDPKVNIKWPLEVTDISEKDRNLGLLDNDFMGI